MQITRSLHPETVPQELHDLLQVGCPRRDKEIIGVLDIGVCIGPGARHKAALGHIQRNGSRFTVRVPSAYVPLLSMLLMLTFLIK